jgi:hypothetical protein
MFWLNMFPSRDGISDTLSPHALMTGYTLDYAKHCRLELGSYVQMHEEHDNLMASRTTGAIALRPTGNCQGGYYFMSLSTGQKLTRNCWTALPIPQDVIDRVDTLGRRCNAAADLAFAWRDGTPILDLENGFDNDLLATDSDYHPSDTNSSNDSSEDGSSDDGSQSRASAAGVDEDDNEHDNDDDFQEEDNEHKAPNEGPDNNGAPNEGPDHVGAPNEGANHVDAVNEAHANEEDGDIAADAMDKAPAFEAAEAPMISEDEDDTEMNDNSIETPGVDDKMEAFEDPLKTQEWEQMRTPLKHRSGRTRHGHYL